MSIIQLLMSFEGRVNRKPYIIANIVLILVYLVGTFVAIGVVTMQMGIDAVDPSSTAFKAVNLALAVLFGLPWTAATVKRLHDRNRPGILAVLFWVPTVVFYIGEHFGLVGSYASSNGVPVFEPNAAGFTLYAAMLVVFLWWLVDLVCLRGTEGANRYGPDPLHWKATMASGDGSG